MNAQQIADLMAADATLRQVFRGVYAADQFERAASCSAITTNLPAAYIINTDPADKPGSHWVAVYVDKPGTSVEVFDSYGKPLHYYNKDLDLFLRNRFCSHTGSALLEQRNILQQPLSTTCAQHCMFFIIQRAVFGMAYSTFINLFTPDLSINDNMVCQFINRYFGTRTVVFNYPALFGN